MLRVFSGIQPTGETHLGNYLGAIRNWVADQHTHDAFYCIVDLHAVTVPQDPAELRDKTIAMAARLFACGLDPEVCTVFAQSHVHQHAELGWLMICTAAEGELSRMTQYKDKTARQASGFIGAGLLCYPALQAADILLYDTHRVPVGDDQRQHVELTRDLAIRFNHRYGETFVVPEHAIAAVGARVMDLQMPENKMSKSSDSPQGTVLLLDEPAEIVRKFKRAVTDSETEVRYDRANKPGVSNLLDILAVATDRKPEALADEFTRYGDLKQATANAVIELLAPVQERYRELAKDPGEVMRLLQIGADRARGIAAVTLERAYRNIGFLRA